MAAECPLADSGDSVAISEVTPALLLEYQYTVSGSSLSHDAEQCSFSPTINTKRVAYAREREQSVLRDVWRRVSSPSACSELVMVLGASGVGKSFLVDSVRNFVERTNEGIFVSSKFDQHSFSRREPFYALVSVLSDICEIAAVEEEKARLVGGHVSEALGEDLSFFAHFVPTLRQLVRINGNNDLSSMENEDNGVETLLRTKRACKTFLGCVSKHRPIVLFLDDVQWIDNESLGLLQSLLTDHNSKNICYLLCARSDDPGFKELPQFLRLPQMSSVGIEPPSLSSQNNKSTLLSCTTINIEDLPEDGVRQVLSGLLGYTEGCGEIAALARVTFQKTRGNPFFISQFLQLLHEENVLTFSGDNERWEWEMQDKMARVDVSDDVLKSIDARIHKLDAATQRALVIAAHIGFRFRIDVLVVALLEDYKRMYPGVEEKMLHQRINRGVSKAEKASMLFRMSGRNNELCFMHDRVHQCCYDMVEKGAEKQLMYLSIGRRLRSLIRHNEGEPSLQFLAADLLNLGKALMDDQNEMMFLVELNQTVAELAVKKSSYSASAHYLRQAMSLLEGQSVWRTNYDLALKLHSSFAWASCYANEIGDCHSAVETAVSNARTVLDKQSAKKAKLRSLEMQGRSKQVIANGIDAMKELGSPLNRNPSKASIIFQILRLRSRLNKMTDSDLLALPKISDARKAAAMDILGRITLSMILSNDKIATLQSGLRVLDYSLTHGWMDKTPWAVCNFGIVEKMVFKNLTKARRYALLAKAMIREFNLPLASSEVIFQSEGLLLPWVRSWEQSIEPLFRGSELGMKNNDLYNAAMCLTILCPILLHTKPLGYAMDKLEFIVSTQIHIQGHSVHIQFSRPFLQQALNLLGREENVMDLNGEAMQEEDVLGATLPASYVASFYLRKLELACYFRSLVLAERWAETNPYEKGKEGLDVFCPSTVYTRFFKAITYLDIAKKRKNARKLQREAAKSVQWLKIHVEKGCYGAEPFLAILQAERATACRKAKIDELRLQYDLAINCCLAHNLTGIAALACERAYISLRQQLKEESRAEARGYWAQAVDLYSRWEAFGKVEALETMSEAVEDKCGRSHPPEEVGIGCQTSIE